MKPVLYIVMRNDLLSLNPGKLAAQAAHVANVAVKYGNRAYVKEWEKESTLGYGTTLVFGAPLAWINYHMPKTVVFDPTYPCEIPYEVGVHLFETGEIARVHLDRRRKRAVYLRHETVGAWAIGDRPQCLDELELYP